MANITCTNCGAATEHTAKFCRRCGSPINFGEASTRKFDEPTLDESRTQHVNVAPTSPSYLAPGYYPPAPSLPTQGLQKSRHKWAIIGLASLVVILLIALVAVLLLRESNEFSGTRTIVVEPQPPAVPPMPGIPTVPPPPPPIPGARGQGQAIGRALVYPGAEVIREVYAGPAATVMKLETADEIDKVVKWYEEKLTDEKVVKLKDGTSILTSGGTAVVLKSIPKGTSITVTQGGVQ